MPDFSAIIRSMTRGWLRRTLGLLAAIAFATGIGLSALQATAMATMMAPAAIGASDGMCPDWDHDNAKAMSYRSALCFVPALAILRSALVVRVRSRLPDVPLAAQPSLVGWMRAPDPQPPRLPVLG